MIYIVMGWYSEGWGESRDWVVGKAFSTKSAAEQWITDTKYKLSMVAKKYVDGDNYSEMLKELNNLDEDIIEPSYIEGVGYSVKELRCVG